MTTAFCGTLAAMDVADDPPVRGTDHKTFNQRGTEVDGRDGPGPTNGKRGVLQRLHHDAALAVEDERSAAGQDDVAWALA